jgi:hypothetical protein
MKYDYNHVKIVHEMSLNNYVSTLKFRLLESSRPSYLFLSTLFNDHIFIVQMK